LATGKRRRKKGKGIEIGKGKEKGRDKDKDKDRRKSQDKEKLRSLRSTEEHKQHPICSTFFMKPSRLQQDKFNQKLWFLNLPHKYNKNRLPSSPKDLVDNRRIL
jgi:hypothetical protein